MNTASLAGLTTRPLMSAYNVSKHAVVALSECLYAELQLATHRIHVSVLCPAFSKTRLAESGRNRPEGVPADPAAWFRRVLSALKRIVEEGTPPEQIARTPSSRRYVRHSSGLLRSSRSSTKAYAIDSNRCWRALILPCGTCGSTHAAHA